MAITSKKSLGKNSAYVQSGKGGKKNTKRAGSSTIKSTGKSTGRSSKKASDDKIDLESGSDFYSQYQNPTVESSLAQRGFSQLRPEILGAFEFIPPIMSDVEDVSQKDGQVAHDTTGSGELIDMQSQLKALRYKETLRFLRNKVGLKTQGAGRGRIKWNLGDKATHAAWKPFYDEITSAKSVLDFLAQALLLYDFGRVTDVKLQKYLPESTRNAFRLSRGKKTTAADSVVRILSKYDNHFVQNKAPGKLQLKGYLTDFLNYPEEYLKTVSSSALMMQIVSDIAARVVYPKTTYFDAEAPSAEWEPGSMPGVNYKSTRTWRIVSQMSKINGVADPTTGATTIDLIGTGEEEYTVARIATLTRPVPVAALDSSDTGGDWYTKGDFLEMFSLISDKKNPKPFYIVARDFMNHCHQKSESTNPAGINDLIRKKIGWRPHKSFNNIANIRTSAGETLGLDAFRKNIGNGTYVATFNEGFGDTESGQNDMASGQSYYVDSFFDGGESGVKEGIKRFTSLSSDLKKLNQGMLEFCKDLFNPKEGMGKSYENTRIMGGSGAVIYESDFEGPELAALDLVGQIEAPRAWRYSMENPASFFQRTWESICDGLHTYKLGYIGPNSHYYDNRVYMGVQYSALMASATNETAAWRGLQWIWAYKKYKYSKSPSTKERLNNASQLYYESIRTAFGMDVGVWSDGKHGGELQFYGNGWDGDEAPMDFAATGTAHDDGSAAQAFNDILWAGSSVFMDAPHQANTGIARLSCDYNGDWLQTQLREGDSDSDTYTDALSADPMDHVGIVYPLHIIELIDEAVKDWDEAIIAEYEVSDSVNPGEKTTDLKIDRYGRLMMAWITTLIVFRETLTLALPRTLPGEWLRMGYSRRAVRSLLMADVIKGKTPSERTSSISGEAYGEINHGEWDPNDEGRGYRDAVLDCLDLFYTYHIPLLEYDILMWNSLFYLTSATKNVISTSDQIVSTFGDSKTGNALITQMKTLQKDPKIGDIVFSTISTEQVRLSRYLASSLGGENRKYPYLPASSAVVPNTPKNLATISKLPNLLDTEDSGAKRIFVVGIPAGMIEFLRRSASRELVSSDFDASSIIKISVWRRNLLTETTAEIPVDYLFAMDKFMLDGRRTWGSTASQGLSEGNPKEIDSAWQWKKGQTIRRMLKESVILKYKRQGLSAIYQGRAFSRKVIKKVQPGGDAESLSKKLMTTCVNITGKSDNILDEVFHNHVVDYYLKQYLKMTMGVDVREEVFCFQDESTEIKGPDTDMQSKREEWATLLKSMYGTRDMASSLTYQRVLGELDRSIFLSPEKYKNRIIYPKIFDRVFCILIDESWWKDEKSEAYDTLDIVTGEGTSENVASMSEATLQGLKSSEDPTYYQYYVTVSILSEIASVSY